VRVILLAFLLLLLAVPLPAAERSRTIDDFEKGLGRDWEVKSFKGETRYAVVNEGDGKVLRADSRGAASGLVYRIRYDLRDYPVLSWRWKVAGTIARGDERSRRGDDYAARVYVVFPSWLPTRTRSLNYIWANRVPRGTILPNAYTGNVKMIAVQSGSGRAGEWVREERNVLEDYRRAFGEDPSTVGAVALMTDTDNTGESATAWYDDIRISAKDR
jgi:hypothetical protein